MEIAVAFAAKVVEYTVAPIGRQLGYLIFYRRNVENLKTQVQRLEETKDRVQRDVDVAQRNGEKIHTDVQSWLSKVNELIEEASKLYGDEGRATTGFYSIGSCPNVLSRHQVSRKSTKLLLEVTKIQMRNFSSVSYNPPPPSLPLTVTLVTKDFKVLDSRTKILTQILEKLKDATIQTIGVWGFGGVGKTTLAKQVAKEVEESKMFGRVVMVTVTVNPDVRQIQGEIADALGLRFDEESEVGRSNRLWQRINQEKSILIIIDDIWGGFELERIGVLQEDGHQGSKLLLTSRNYDVLNREMGIQVGFRLEVLQEDEAWSLFEEMAGDTVKDPNVKPVAIEVVKRCAGLPVLIATVAKALKDEALFVWKNALKQLERFDKEVMHEKVFSALELSYNHLKGQEIKSLFLLIALHGQRSVYKYNLLIIIVGLRLFKYVDTLEDARNRLDKFTKDLKASCFLIEDHSEIVKIHDLVRDAGSSIAKKDQLFRIDFESESKEWPRKDILENFHGLFLSARHQDDLPERLECPQLQVFALKYHQNDLEISDSFFEVMREVKVLCLSKMMLISSPPCIFHGLKSLRALYLYKCILEDLAIVGELTNLEILSVYKSGIKQLPSEIGRLRRLKMLDLKECNSLEVIPPRVISNLICLEELNMEGSFTNWEIEARCNSKSCNASLSELNELPNLRSLDIRIPYFETLSTGMIFSFFEKLQRFKIDMGRRSIYSSNNLQILALNFWTWIECRELENGIKTLVEKVQTLQLNAVNGVKNVFHDLNAKGFPNLEVLYLWNLNNLVHICRGPFTEESFCKLRIVSVYKCERLKNVFPFSMRKVIRQLVEISVSNCKSMEEIVSSEREAENLEPELDDINEFTQLRNLTIEDLPALISFCSMEMISSTSQGINEKLTNATEIKEIDVTRKYENSLPLFSDKVLFPNMERLNLSGMERKFWDHRIPANFFSKLKLLEVTNCQKLVTIFSSDLARNFQSLETLTVRNCILVEEIFYFQELRNGKTLAGAIPCHLKYLCLEKLPKLKHICNGNHKGVLKIFQDLKDVEVRECENLNYIFPASLAKYLGQLEKLKIISSGITEIVAEDEETSEVISFNFHQVKYLSLLRLPKLKTFYPGLMIALEWPLLKELHVVDCSETFIFSSQVSDHHGDGLEMHRQQGKPFILSEKVIVPNLKNLCLGGNTAIMFYLNDQFQDLFHNLQILQVRDCSSLRSFVYAALSLVPFHNIHTLKIDSCDGLINLVTLSTVKSTLVQLQELSIKNCEMIEVIISSSDHQGQHVEEDEIAFPRLKSLELFNLPNLKSFCSQKSTLHFSSLKEVIVSVCPKMGMFSPFFADAPLLKGVLISHKFFEGDLNSTIRQMFMEKLAEMAKGFPSTINHPLHEKHQLLLARRTYHCDGCGASAGYGWSYVCGRCDFDLHPNCALEDSNKAINEAGYQEVKVV
ncbi:Disease resistance protein [Quillaja saponaria]|uniref:Disease resistance protein n=1 Tax=Quillaja saponaria TaxID=32244 RepID=A0AAD7PG64_QUISA|nr:Disease resistance protein [Quillaja saponaria]